MPTTWLSLEEIYKRLKTSCRWCPTPVKGSDSPSLLEKRRPRCSMMWNSLPNQPCLILMDRKLKMFKNLLILGMWYPTLLKYALPITEYQEPQRSSMNLGRHCVIQTYTYEPDESYLSHVDQCTSTTMNMRQIEDSTGTGR